jgi:hypothetical protein
MADNCFDYMLDGYPVFLSMNGPQMCTPFRSRREVALTRGFHDLHVSFRRKLEEFLKKLKYGFIEELPFQLASQYLFLAPSPFQLIQYDKLYM